MKAFAWLMVLVVFVAGCVGGNSTTTDTLGEEGQCPPEYNDIEPIETDDSITWKICSKSFAFEPSTITGKVGKKLIIESYQPDIPHSFVIDELDVNERLTPGNKTFEFTPTKAGEFAITCTVPGHKEGGMVGKMIVE